VNANLLKQNITLLKKYVLSCQFLWVNRRFCIGPTEKSRGNKKSVTKKKQNNKILAFWHGLKMAVTWLFAAILISIYYVYSVEDSTLMSILDQFRFSFVFLELPKIGPNRYT